MWEGREWKSDNSQALYVIKIFSNNRFSHPLVLNSLPTKENGVGGIFIIVIINQNTTLCNFA